MRLEKHDIEVLLPASMFLISKSGYLKIVDMNYHLEEDVLHLEAHLLYAGMPIGIKATVHGFVKGGALGLKVLNSQVDSLFMKGDVLSLLKPLLKGQKNICIEEDCLYFYHPKFEIAMFQITSAGVELRFK